MRTFLSEAFSFLICRIKKRQAEACRFWSWWRDSDPRPIDYESIALPLRHTSIAPTFTGARLIITSILLKVNIFYALKIKLSTDYFKLGDVCVIDNVKRIEQESINAK